MGDLARRVRAESERKWLRVRRGLVVVGETGTGTGMAAADFGRKGEGVEGVAGKWTKTEL
jgi:hypothetical protein